MLLSQVIHAKYAFKHVCSRFFFFLAKGKGPAKLTFSRQ